MLNHNSAVGSIGSLHVAELAQKAGVTPATVRYYARIGMLSPGREAENGYRCFSSTDLRRLGFIRKAKALGLTIGDIKTVLESVDEGEVPCAQVKSLVVQRRVSIKEQITALQAIEACISEALMSWSYIGEPVPDDGELCPLIERIETERRSLQGRSRELFSNTRHHLQTGLRI